MTELDVFLAGTLAGRLIRKDNGNLQFRYAADYAGPPLSWALPIQEEAHPHSTCRAVFGGLLPEGASREAISRRLGISAGNDYSLLESIGGDCAGAISILPAGVVQNWTPLLEEMDHEELDRLVSELPQRPLAAGAGGGMRLSLAGAQPKLPVVLDDKGRTFLALSVGAATTHIVKPEPSAFPGLVDNEGFCLELAALCGMATAKAEKRHTASGLPYLVVERYDRDLTQDPIRRLHQEDFCQALAQPSDHKYQEDGGPSVRDCIELIRDAVAIPAQDVPRFWEALIYNWLIGNCDAHGKNFSLLYDGRVPTLAPLYDLVSTSPYDDLTTRLAMSIGGARNLNEVNEGTWIELAQSVGLSERYARSTLVMLTGRVVEGAEELMQRSEHQNASTRRIYKEILTRSDRF